MVFPARLAANSGKVAYQTPLTAAPRVAPSGDIYFTLMICMPSLRPGRSTGGKTLRSKGGRLGPDGTFRLRPDGGFSPTRRPACSGALQAAGGQGLMAGPWERTYLRGDRQWRARSIVADTWRLIWNQPGYVNFQGTGLTPVPLTPTRLYLRRMSCRVARDF